MILNYWQPYDYVKQHNWVPVPVANYLRLQTKCKIRCYFYSLFFYRNMQLVVNEFFCFLLIFCMVCQWAVWTEFKLVLACCSLNMLLPKQKPFWFQWNWDLQWMSKSSQKISQQNIVHFYIINWTNTNVWLECELWYLGRYCSRKRDIFCISSML